jgi:hypothetical protein
MITLVCNNCNAEYEIEDLPDGEVYDCGACGAGQLVAKEGAAATDELVDEDAGQEVVDLGNDPSDAGPEGAEIPYDLDEAGSSGDVTPDAPMEAASGMSITIEEGEPTEEEPAPAPAEEEGEAMLDLDGQEDEEDEDFEENVAHSGDTGFIDNPAADAPESKRALRHDTIGAKLVEVMTAGLILGRKACGQNELRAGLMKKEEYKRSGEYHRIADLLVQLGAIAQDVADEILESIYTATITYPDTGETFTIADFESPTPVTSPQSGDTLVTMADVKLVDVTKKPLTVGKVTIELA